MNALLVVGILLVTGSDARGDDALSTFGWKHAGRNYGAAHQQRRAASWPSPSSASWGGHKEPLPAASPSAKNPWEQMLPPFVLGGSGLDTRAQTQRNLQAPGCGEGTYDRYYCEGGLIKRTKGCDDSMCGTCTGDVTSEADDLELLDLTTDCLISRASAACVDDDTIEFYSCETGDVLGESDVDGGVSDAGYCVDACSASLDTLPFGEGECISTRFFCDANSTLMVDDGCTNCTDFSCALQVPFEDYDGCDVTGSGFGCIGDEVFLSDCDTGEVVFGPLGVGGRAGWCLGDGGGLCDPIIEVNATNGTNVTIPEEPCLRDLIFCDDGVMKVSYSCDATCGSCIGQTLNETESFDLVRLLSDCEYSTNTASCDGDTLTILDCSTMMPVEYETGFFTETGGYCVSPCIDDWDDGTAQDCKAFVFACNSDDEVLYSHLCPAGTCDDPDFTTDECGFTVVANQYVDLLSEISCEDSAAPTDFTYVCSNFTLFATLCENGVLIPITSAPNGACEDESQGINADNPLCDVPCTVDEDCTIGDDTTCICPETTTTRALLFGYDLESTSCVCG